MAEKSRSSKAVPFAGKETVAEERAEERIIRKRGLKRAMKASGKRRTAGCR